jgi:hypothetical protein
MDGWTDGRMDGWMNGRMDGRTHGRMDGRLSASLAQGRFGGFYSRPASESSSIRQCSKNINIPAPKTETLQTGPKKQFP